jgi:hypothetical protein
MSHKLYSLGVQSLSCSMNRYLLPAASVSLLLMALGWAWTHSQDLPPTQASGITVAGPAVATAAAPARPTLATTKRSRGTMARTPQATAPNQPAASEPAEVSAPLSVCGAETRAERVDVIREQSPVFIRPQVMPEPLARFPAGTRLTVVKREAQWLLVNFDDRRWGQRAGYVHCADVTASQ